MTIGDWHEKRLTILEAIPCQTKRPKLALIHRVIALRRPTVIIAVPFVKAAKDAWTSFVLVDTQRA
jgi:hypothetical protein